MEGWSLQKIHIAWFDKESTEGGLARNKAFADYLEKKGFKIVNFYPNNIFARILNIFRMTIYLLGIENSIVLIHGNFFITNYLVQIFQFKWYAKLVFCLLKKVSRSNKLILEINDLRYEQAIDVKSKKVSKKFDELERTILYGNVDAYYVFAANLMKEYAINKYDLDNDKVVTVINGGPILMANKSYKHQQNSDSLKIKLVYAGTLNKGRQIEHMIDECMACDNIDLYLMGVGGEWIPERYKNNENLFYMGQLSEKDAHIIVSQCDLGLIPYDENGLYYNICYPTKASFYMTAGIPFLATNLKELMLIFSIENCCMFDNIDLWSERISKLNQKKIKEMKDTAKIVGKSFTWDMVLKKIDSLIE